MLDSMDSFHATPYMKYFQDYVQGDLGQVYLGDYGPSKIVGKGRIQLKLQDVNQWLPK